MRGPKWTGVSPPLRLYRSTSPAGGPVHRSFPSYRRIVGVHDLHVRFYSISARVQLPVTFTRPAFEPSPSNSVAACPDPTCECAATPALPKPIDRQANIRESAPGYNQHVVICTGRNDWKSRIEDEGMQPDETVAPEPPTTKERFKGLMKSFSSPGWQRGSDSPREVGLARGLKARLGRHGDYFDPMRPMLVTNGSFSPPPRLSIQGADTVPDAAAFLFPAFQYVTGIPDSSSGHEAFLQTFLAANGTQTDSGSVPWHSAPVTIPTILICSHGMRDTRCGVLGPLLHAEFCRQLARMGISTNDTDTSGEAGPTDTAGPELWTRANVGMVSHIGGHKWAGNVIVYMPPSPLSKELGGKGVWYGRVEPRHIQGILEETVLSGRVIEELCRGVRG